MIVLYDNDAECVANFKRTCELNIPDNMKILKLPDHPSFKSFPTSGPNGSHPADINGQAAAIECYFDLPAGAGVRWSNYNSKAGAYQGELIGKTSYMRKFLDQRTRQPGYDYTKLVSVIETIVQAAIGMRETIAEQELDELY